MQKLELKGITPRAKYRSYKGDFNGTVKNLLLDKVIDTANHKTYYDRNFKTTSVNQKWTTDVSEFHIAAGKLYLSPILDMHNAEIVSFNISTAPNFHQTVDMLNKAFDVHTNLNGLTFSFIIVATLKKVVIIKELLCHLKQQGILYLLKRKPS